jgi:hypothetical protein
VIDLLISDIAACPKVFFLQGALLDASSPAKICGMQPPDDLVESKAILLPTIRDTKLLTTVKGDDVETVTAFPANRETQFAGQCLSHWLLHIDLPLRQRFPGV